MDQTQFETQEKYVEGKEQTFEVKGSAQVKPVATKKVNARYLTELAALTAIIILMAAVPALGYIPIGPVQITLLVIPVAVGSIVLGPKAGTFLGFVFGVTSLLKGSAMFMLVPLQTIFVSIVPRMLIGVVCGWTFIGLMKLTKNRLASTAIACVVATLTNTILYLSSFILVLGSFMADYNEAVFGFIKNNNFFASFGIYLGMVGLNVVCEVAAALIIGVAICNALWVSNKGRSK